LVLLQIESLEKFGPWFPGSFGSFEELEWDGLQRICPQEKSAK